MTIDKRDQTMNVASDRLAGGAGGNRRTLLLALLLLPLGLSGCSNAEAEGAPEAGAYTRVLNVEVATVEVAPFTEVIRLTGTAQADKDVVISAEESGVIREINVDKGRWVQAGQAIFRMDSEILKAQVDQARALSNMARETWERRKGLFEEDRVGSELVYLEAKYTAEQAAANLALLEERLARTVIRAPISGILDSREIEVGTMVAPGTPVARIVDIDPVKITAGVPERYASDVQTGAKATVIFDVLRDEAFVGEISYVGAVVNPKNRTFPVELRLPNPGGAIKPEMVANVEVVRRTVEAAMVVPQEALTRVEEGYVAFVVVNEGGEDRVRSRAVTLGASQQNAVVVTSGLEAGDRLIVVGQQTVSAGDRVTVVSGR